MKTLGKTLGAHGVEIFREFLKKLSEMKTLGKT